MPPHSEISPDYRHYAKEAKPQGLLETAAWTLKYYHLEKPGEPVPAPVDAAARAALAGATAEAAGPAQDCGFAVLHRCGADFYFLLIGAWRGTNEVWEAVWYLDAGMDAFAPFAPAYPAEAGVPRPTFCVWELGVVAHESAAWSTYLASPRMETDFEAWRKDLFSGAV